MLSPPPGWEGAPGAALGAAQPRGNSKLISSGEAAGAVKYHIVGLDLGDMIHITKTKITVEEEGILGANVDQDAIEYAVGQLQR